MAGIFFDLSLNVERLPWSAVCMMINTFHPFGFGKLHRKIHCIQELKCSTVDFDPRFQDLHQSLGRWINGIVSKCVSICRHECNATVKCLSLSLFFAPWNLWMLHAQLATRKSYGIIIAATNKNNIIRGKEMAIMFNKKKWQTKHTDVISNCS